MYKVFVNNKPIILSDQPTTDSQYEVCLFKDINLDEILHKLRQSKTIGIYLYHTNLAYLWQNFKAYFTTVYAAGGLVVKDDDTFLLIYRNRHWDLPKGRMEEGEEIEETAIREVEEECGISALKIIKPLQKSYHIYYEDKRNKLKITYWFLMSTTYNKSLTPQKEEGITKAVFIPQKEVATLYTKMYLSIAHIITEYIASKKSKK